MAERVKTVTLPLADATNPDQSTRSNLSANRRPVSVYDNIRENGDPQDQNGIELRNLGSLRDRTPTQAHLINTTVPQSITGARIGGKHEPTRNSLRHSRMIVMTRTGNVPKKYLPPIIRSYKLATALVGLQTLLGFALATFSLWLFLWSPSLRTRDNPYWSGLPLLLSGIVGLGLLCCCRKEYPGMSRAYVTYSSKALSIFLSTVAGAACLTACTFAIIHLISLNTMACGPVNQLNATCFCKVESSNGTALPIKSYHYTDLSCPEVESILSVLIIFSCGTNGLGGITALWYVYLHWISRYSYTYSKVRSEEEKRPVVISNA